MPSNEGKRRGKRLRHPSKGSESGVRDIRPANPMVGLRVGKLPKELGTASAE